MSLFELVTRERPELARVQALKEHLDELDHSARAAWPTLSVSPATWARHLAMRLEPGSTSLDGPGLLLTCASLSGDRAALTVLDAELRAAAAPGLARLRLDRAAVDDVLQRARDHLLVSQGEVPRLARYGGRGALRDWLQTVCVRLATDLHRQRAPEARLEDLVFSVAGSANPERDVVTADSRHHVTRALEEAFGELDLTQRALLRMHVVERLGLDDLLPLFAASRATLARWVVEARETFARSARDRLAERVPPDELDALMNERSLDLSIERILRAQPKPPPANR